jgi:DNA segregation ATPase FtsK/SpoIIIE-like protein
MELKIPTNNLCMGLKSKKEEVKMMILDKKKLTFAVYKKPKSNSHAH